MRINFTKISGLMVISIVAIMMSCSAPVTLTGWKNPKEHQTVSRVVVWAMFNRLEFRKPFEDASVKFLNSRGVKAIGSISFLNPDRKYELPELERILDSIGADGIVIYNYTGTDKTENYIPQTTTVYPEYYSNYYGYYSYGFSMYAAPGYNVVTSGGYTTTTQVVNLTANLYANSDNALLWTGKITVTDPQYVDQSADKIMSYVYSEWVREQLVPAKK